MGRPRRGSAHFNEDEYLIEDLLDKIEQLKVSFTEIEKKVGLSGGYLSRDLFDRGKNPRIKTLQKIANAVGLKLIFVETDGPTA